MTQSNRTVRIPQIDPCYKYSFSIGPRAKRKKKLSRDTEHKKCKYQQTMKGFQKSLGIKKPMANWHAVKIYQSVIEILFLVEKYSINKSTRFDTRSNQPINLENVIYTTGS